MPYSVDNLIDDMAENIMRDHEEGRLTKTRIVERLERLWRLTSEGHVIKEVI